MASSSNGTVKVLVGDLLRSDAQTLVNTVNCVGVMGKGIALEFKRRFPDMFADYRLRCERGEVAPGVPFLYRSMLPPWIVNFPTKDHWRSVSRVEDIERGLQYLVDHAEAWEITSIAAPPLGCGNGQLAWREVGPLMYRYLGALNVPVELYAPYGTPPRELTTAFLANPAEPSRRHHGREAKSGGVDAASIALVEIVDRLEKQPYASPVGRTMFQKIAYVATREGLPTGLRYREGSYGPFSDDLDPVRNKLVNNNLIQESRHGRMFRVIAGPNFAHARRAHADALAGWSDLIAKTVDLFSRLDSGGAEIAASVLFAADQLQARLGAVPSEGEVLEAVMDWKRGRKPPLAIGEVASAIRHLGMLRWLRVRYDAELPVPKPQFV